MQKILAALRGFFMSLGRRLAPVWRRYRALALWLQIVIGVIGIGLILAGLSALINGKAAATPDTARTVTLRTVAELSGGASGGSVVGTVRARSEAELFAEAGGSVKSVNATLGQTVPAGFVIASLENATEAASVLQAEGAYDAAVAARSAVSPEEPAVAARNAYRSAYDKLDNALETDVDTVFGSPTPYGPNLLIVSKYTDREKLSLERAHLADLMKGWREDLATADSADPQTLLNAGEAIAQEIASFVEDLLRNANDANSGATSDQLAALASARTDVNAVLASLSSARATYLSGSTSSTASVDASVKSALGTLKLAQANYEKTVIRAPIAGTVNFLPIHVGDYVTNLEHVATVAQNGALEITAYVSEDAAAALSAGTSVSVEGDMPAVITSIAPALDPTTKQIEVHLALSGDASGVVNGQSVSIALPGSATTTDAGPVFLPLAAVKLTPSSRVVFGVGEDGRLVAYPVVIGDVHGDRIEITSDLPRDLHIVTDARGLAEGQKVKLAPETPAP